MQTSVSSNNPAVYNRPTVKFAKRLIGEHPGDVLGDDRVPDLYAFVQKVRSRGKVPPRQMLALANSHCLVNFRPSLSDEIQRRVVRRAVLDCKRGIRVPPIIETGQRRMSESMPVYQPTPREMAELARQEALRRQREPQIDRGTDVEIARRALFELKQEYREIVHSEGEFWFYSRKQWRPFDSNRLHRFIYEFDGREYGETGHIRLSKARVDSIIHVVASLAAAPDFFRDPAPGINCHNGFITFDAEGEPTLNPHSREHRARHTLPGRWREWSTSYAPGSLLEQLLLGCFADADEDCHEKYDLIAEIAGCVALGYSAKLINPKAIVSYGQSAGNGKSEILQMIRGLIPANAACSIPPDRFNDPNYACQLAGKLLNASDETGNASAIGSDMFKAIVTGEPITARDLYRSAQTFRSMALNLLATNTLPGFQGGFDRGVQRRLLVLTFNRTIPEAERIEHIGARIADEEADLLLAFAVEGASRLIVNRQFTEPESSKAALRDWIFGADPVLAWIDACATVAIGEKLLPKQEAYEHFRSWARREGFNEPRLPAINNFVIRVKAHDTRIGETRNKKDGRCFVNLQIVADRAASRASTAAEEFA